jgi:DNA polymerase-3 subunit delta
VGKALQGYRKLFDTLKKGDVRSLYLLYGPEEYLKREFVRELLDRALPEKNRAFNLDILYGDEFDRPLFDDRLGSFPLFTERRVVILKNFDGLSLAHKDHVIEAADRVAAAVVFVIESASEKPDNARLRNLKKVADNRGLSAPFPLLDDQETIERVTARFRREGFDIEPGAMDLLVESVGTRLIDLGNEVDKVLLASREGEPIDRELVSGVVGKYRSESVFSLLDELSRRNTEVLLRTVDGLVDAGEEPVFILAMLLKRTVLLLQAAVVSRELGRSASNDRSLAAAMGGINPYYASKLRTQASRFKPEELEQLLDNLRWADIKLKTTQADARTILEEALLASHLRKTLASNAA